MVATDVPAKLVFNQRRHRFDTLSAGRAAALVRRFAYEADRAAYVARGRTALSDRRVGLRPAPDTMSVLSGLLPVEQGVACLAALRRHTDTVVAAGDTRTRDQIMADTLVERVTGQARATDVNVEVGIVLPAEALLDPEAAGAAEVTGYGPIPAGIAHDVLADTRGQRWWRRLFTAPGGLVGGDPRRRSFDGVLAHLIRVRDGGRCRDPFCDAPIRHLDHIHPHRAGGPTSLAKQSVSEWYLARHGVFPGQRAGLRPSASVDGSRVPAGVVGPVRTGPVDRRAA
jgi:hypothetical protein